MSKELTEQWRNRTIKEGYYYVLHKSNKKYICLILNQDYVANKDEIVEVLAPVPTHEEWVKTGTWYTEKSHNKLVKKVERLEKQLKEAEEVIRLYFKNTQNAAYKALGMNDGYYKRAFIHATAKEYLEKYGVENE